jgi:hypothetical protein
MSDAFIAAIPGALATIVAGIIGAYAVLNKGGTTAPPPAGATPEESAALAAVAVRGRRYSKKFAVLVAGAGLLLGALVMGIAYVVGHTQQEREQKARLTRDIALQTKSYADLIARAEGKRPYALPNILMLVSVERSPDGNSVLEEQKTVYLLHALTDIKSNNDSQAAVFPEEYDSRHEMKRIPGSDREIVPDKDFQNKWDVRFNTAQGQREILVTGVQHTRPYKETIPGGLCMFPMVGTTEECFCYPNDQNDVIGEITIIVQSKSLDLNVDGGAQAMLKRADGTLQPIEAVTRNLGDGTTIPSTVVARFPDVKDHDIAGVKVRWRPQ